MAEVTVSQRGRFSHSVSARGHELVLDEPTDFGGDDTGPSPWEYVLAGMGGCTAVTLQMYAERKGWQLDGVEVTLRRDDQEEAVEMKVSISGDFDESQRQRLEQVADRCPVVRALREGIEVRKRVTSAGT